MEELEFLSSATTLSKLLIISTFWMFLKSVFLLPIPYPKFCLQHF